MKVEMTLTIEMCYYGEAPPAYLNTTALLNKAYQTTGFIPNIGDLIFLEQEESGYQGEEAPTVTVVSRNVAFSGVLRDECHVTLEVFNQNLIPPMVRKLPKDF